MRALLNAFADGGGGAAPFFAGNVFRNDHLWLQVVDLIPGEILSRHQVCAESLKVAGRDVVVKPNRRIAYVSLSLRTNEISSRVLLLPWGRLRQTQRR